MKFEHPSHHILTEHQNFIKLKDVLQRFLKQGGKKNPRPF